MVTHGPGVVGGGGGARVRWFRVGEGVRRDAGQVTHGLGERRGAE